jgi:hypothetical protein
MKRQFTGADETLGIRRLHRGDVGNVARDGRGYLHRRGESCGSPQ